MTLLLLQMSIVLLVAVACGRLAGKLDQATGHRRNHWRHPDRTRRSSAALLPHLSANLFPQSSLAQLEVLSTVGLVLFLFLIGDGARYEPALPPAGMTAMAGSGMSILLPFHHGRDCSLIPSASGSRRTASASIPFVLFLGIAMSITAFPVLARIIRGAQSAIHAARNHGDPLRRRR